MVELKESPKVKIVKLEELTKEERMNLKSYINLEKLRGEDENKDEGH